MKKLVLLLALVAFTLTVNADIYVRGKAKKKPNGAIKCKGNEGICVHIHTASVVVEGSNGYIVTTNLDSPEESETFFCKDYIIYTETTDGVEETIIEMEDSETIN